MNRLLSSGPEKNDGDECLGGAASPHPADRIRVNGGWKPPLRHVNLFCTLALAILGEVQGAEYSQEDAATFLNTYCVTCHGGEEPKGDRRLDVLTGDLANDFATVETMGEGVRSTTNGVNAAGGEKATDLCGEARHCRLD